MLLFGAAVLIPALLIPPSTTPWELWLDACVQHRRTTFQSLRTSKLLSFIAEKPHYLSDAMPWSLDTCSTQRSPIHRVQSHGGSNRDTHFYPPHNNSSVFLTTTMYVRRSGQIINGTRSGQITPFQFQTSVHTHPEWPSQEERESGSTASAPVSDVSAPACTNGVWPPLRPVCVVQNKPSIMSSSTVQYIEPPTDYTAWRFWTMRKPNGCSTAAPIWRRASSG